MNLRASVMIHSLRGNRIFAREEAVFGRIGSALTSRSAAKRLAARHQLTKREPAPTLLSDALVRPISKVTPDDVTVFLCYSHSQRKW